MDNSDSRFLGHLKGDNVKGHALWPLESHLGNSYGGFLWYLTTRDNVKGHPCDLATPYLGYSDGRFLWHLTGDNVRGHSSDLAITYRGNSDGRFLGHLTGDNVKGHAPWPSNHIWARAEFMTWALWLSNNFFATTVVNSLRTARDYR